MKKNKRRETQGSQKIRQYLEDLRRNKYFRKELNKYLKIRKKEMEDWPRKLDIIDYFLDEYIRLGKITKGRIKKYEKNGCQKIIRKLSEKYAVDQKLLSYITFPILVKYPKAKDPNAEIDMCNLIDNCDDNFGVEHGSFAAIPLILNPPKQSHFIAYPISIDIHRFATKRDVLDYVEKKWWLIENALHQYGERVRIKKRKYGKKLLDFIWKNQNLKMGKIKELLDKKFPGNGLVYYEIYKINSLERRRRKEELTVGQ